LVVAGHERAGAIKERKRATIGKLKENVAKVIVLCRSKISILDHRLNERKAQYIFIEVPGFFRVSTAKGVMMKALRMIARAALGDFSFEAFWNFDAFKATVYFVVRILCRETQITRGFHRSTPSGNRPRLRCANSACFS
jgi:hypothetical protein